MNQIFSLALSQKLTMTPQLYQSIKMLQCSSLELMSSISEALDENYMLEEASVDEVEEDYLPKDWGESGSNGSYSDDFDFLQNIKESPSLYAHISFQIKTHSFSTEDVCIAEYIADSLDKDGFFTESYRSVVKGVKKAFEIEIEKSDVERVLSVIQTFEPSGVASRNIKECLLNQLSDKSDAHFYLLARDIISNNFDKLVAKDGKALATSTGAKRGDIVSAVQLIQSLNPRPGRSFTSEPEGSVVPDVRVKETSKGYVVELNPKCYPKVQVSEVYLEMVKSSGLASKEQVKQIKEKFLEADALVKGLKSRGETILKVAAYIVNEQRAFFSKGAVAMKPMILKSVAESLDMHESTVSRATNGKYIETPVGMLELKFFFNSSIGQFGLEDKSSAEIKARIKTLIDSEDGSSPYSDQALSLELKKQFRIDVARRTVAKYRESLGFSSSADRKEALWKF